ncbi:MAG: S8 family serine peptidase, partial [Clostridiaceae bacterium]|nr:S8 family serine peptidase [Clostridiaceae bacterium]
MNKNKFCKSIISVLVVLAFISSSVSAFASSKTQDEATSDFKKRIIVKLKHTDKKDEVLKNVKKNLKLSKLKEKKNLKLEKINVFEIDDPDAIDSLISEFSKSPQVEFVQEDYLLETMGIPFDERLFEQWWINNSGQVINGQPGISGIDINVLNAWEMTKGSDEIVVGVLDTGIDIEHTDLKDKIFVNTAEIPDNGIDDDLNGFVDDFKGWDFYNNDNSVFDSNENDKHGSHVAGTIAAKEDAYGICGTAPNVKILPLKFLNGNVGYTSDVIEAISYCEEMGIDIINCSWGGTEENKLLKEAISKSSAVFICAAGNMGTDTTKVYPASYDLPNVISVAALDNRGNLASFSNYGNNVDVAAPGAGILSTIPGDAYGYLSGTSMAAPVVTGIAALLKSYCPDISSSEIVRRIENNVVKTPKLEGKIFSGGMVDAEAVLNNVVPEPKDMTDYIDKAGAKEIICNPMDNTLGGNGKTSDVLIIDDSGVEKRQTLPQNIGLTTVSQNVYSQQNTLSYTSQVETEPNNYSSEAMPVETGTIYGTIQSSSDEDWYVVYLEANKKYTFNLRGLQQGDDLDLFLTNPDLSFAGSSMTIGNGNENIVFTTTTAGYYYVSTYCFSYETSGEHEYQI